MCLNNSSNQYKLARGGAVQGMVSVRGDAGQVVAGNAVINIENYVTTHPSRYVLAAAFFSE